MIDRQDACDVCRVSKYDGIIVLGASFDGDVPGASRTSVIIVQLCHRCRAAHARIFRPFLDVVRRALEKWGPRLGKSDDALRSAIGKERRHGS